MPPASWPRARAALPFLSLVLSFSLPSIAVAAQGPSPAPFDRLLRERERHDVSPGKRPVPVPETAIRARAVTDRLERPLSPGLCFGATWVDLDGDGDLDLTVVVDVDSSGELSVWRNDGDSFHEITSTLGLSGIGFPRSAAWLDLDRDGDLDLFVTRRSDAASNLLYENRGDTLVDVTAGSGLDGHASDVSQAWADFDGDGDFDLFLPGVVVTSSRLMRNDGGFHFTDVTLGNSIDPSLQSLSAAWGDFDGDGDPDLAIGETFSFHLYENGGPDGFADITPAGFPSTAFIVVPSWADVDGDGDLDLLVGGGFPPILFENRFAPGADPSSFFVDRTNDWGSGSPRGSGGSWADLDLDGDLDLLNDGGSIGARLFENLINLGFGLLDVTDVAGLPLLNGITWHPSPGDFDGDGRIDFFAPNEFSPELYRNESQTAGGALRLALVPREGGVPIGARVTLALDGRLQMREVSWPTSAFSFGSPQVILATGARRVIPSVDVRWASGRRERFHGLKVGPLETLVEGRGQPIPGEREQQVASPPMASPAAFALSCNPCRERLRAELTAAEASVEPSVALPGGAAARVRDARGRIVRLLARGGSHLDWDLRDENGRRVPPGLYWLEAPGTGGRERVARFVVLP